MKRKGSVGSAERESNMKPETSNMKHSRTYISAKAS